MHLLKYCSGKSWNAGTFQSKTQLNSNNNDGVIIVNNCHGILIELLRLWKHSDMFLSPQGKYCNVSHWNCIFHSPFTTSLLCWLGFCSPFKVPDHTGSVLMETMLWGRHNKALKCPFKSQHCILIWQHTHVTHGKKLLTVLAGVMAWRSEDI